MRLIRRMLAMCELSWEILTKSILISCFFLFYAVVLLLGAGSYSAETVSTYRLALELARLPQAILLVGVIASVVAEDFKARR